jgi:hypothetical protein
MLFQFKLRPLEEVRPWGDDKPNLHWFGLSDGWYWWQVGSQELFRYSQLHIDQLAEEYPDYHSELPYEDYQLGRPWEDLLGFISEIIDPVPNDLADRTQDKEEWQNLLDTAHTWMEAQDDDPSWAAWDLHDLAFGWWLGRKWDAGYLRCPPQIWLWTQGDTFHLRWDNRDVVADGVPVWDATSGEITMPVTTFMEEVMSFHERLMAAMAERVAAVRSGVLSPEITIDIDGLMKDQNDRSLRLAHILAMPQQKQDWNEVREAISTIERMCYNNDVEGP